MSKWQFFAAFTFFVVAVFAAIRIVFFGLVAAAAAAVGPSHRLLFVAAAAFAEAVALVVKAEPLACIVYHHLLA